MMGEIKHIETIPHDLNGNPITPPPVNYLPNTMAILTLLVIVILFKASLNILFVVIRLILYQWLELRVIDRMHKRSNRLAGTNLT